MANTEFVTLDMIKMAQERLKNVAHHTDLMPTTALSNECNCQVHLKLENTQRTGSFKLRGAYNKIASLSKDALTRGIVASSAGNHAQGVALGAKVYGAKATICMPSGAPLSKIEATRRLGAHVVLTGQVYDDAYNKALELMKTDGLTFCHPFNDPEVIAGQGTIGLEILKDLPNVDVIIVPIGGGGLIAGIAVAAKTMNPHIRIIGVQTENMPSMKLSLKENKLITVPPKVSLADGIMVKTPGNITFQIIKKYVDSVIVLSESEIARGIFYLLERVKVVAEGAGAAPVAALIANKVPNIANKNVVALVSGGNIDINKIGQIINVGLIKSWRKVYIDVVLPDQPAELSKLAGLIAADHGNILSVHHDRSQRDIVLGSVHVSIELEIMNKEHLGRLLYTLQEKGYNVEVL